MLRDKNRKGLLKKRTEINEEIVRLRKGLSLSEYANQCAEKVHGYSSLMLLQRLGEVLPDNKTKNFVWQQLVPNTVSGLELFAACQLITRGAL